MIDGAHVVLYSQDPEADRAAIRDVLGFRHIDIGNGRLIFALPPTEAGVDLTEGPPGHELYLTCDDVEATVADLAGTVIEVIEPVVDRRWGLVTRLRLPSGCEVPLYQPLHARP
jgi:hypothetical protein